MRHVLAAIFVFAIGAPAASALPSSVGSAGLSKAEGAVLVAKRGKTQAKAKGGKSRGASGAGGIHPLVGSGDY